MISFLHCGQETLVVVTLIFFGISGCNPNINPIQKDEHHFSIYGFLNASADTQFVRIEKIRDGQFTGAPDNLDIRVKLTNVTTGESSMMKDSLFYYYSKGYAHNYYTTLPIRSKQTYRLDIIDNEIVASAQADIPKSFPEPVVTGSTKDFVALRVSEIDRLIAVKTIYYSYVPCSGGFNSPCPDEPTIKKSIFQHLQDTVRYQDHISISINQSEDMKKIYPNADDPHPFKTTVIVAAGTKEWPDFMNLSKDSISIPRTVSNVKGGVGILGGIVSDTVLVYSK